MQQLRRKSQRKRRGVIVVMAAICLVMTFAFLAFSTDFGYIVVTGSELQNAADSGALSGARALPKSREAAIEAAKTWAGKNIAARESVVVADGDVEIGLWNDDTATFTPLPADPSNSPNAVRVTCSRTAANGNPLNLFFAPMLGTASANLTATAIAATTLSCGGFVATEYAEVSSGFTDSYDSRHGSYASQVPGDEGHVCSNKDIVVKAPVNGDASPGTDYSVSIQGGGVVTGSTNPHTPRSYPLAEAGNAAFLNDNDLINPSNWLNGKLSIPNGQVVDFPGGTIYATSVSINGELRISSATTIYIEETASIAGQGIVNTSQIPSDLKIVLLTQSGRTSTFAGLSDVFATIYGPGAGVTTAGNAAFYGGIIAGQLKFTNSGGCHADGALKYNKDFSDAVKLVQ
jgi:Flp pilus assembly protein TadG